MQSQGSPVDLYKSTEFFKLGSFDCAPRCRVKRTENLIPILSSFNMVSIMARLRHKFQSAKNPYISADAVNLEDFPCWSKSKKEIFEQLMFTGGFYNIYYMNETEMIRNCIKVVSAYTADNPVSAAKLAINGRKRGFMRSLPILAVSFLSHTQNQQVKKKAFVDAFRGIIITPRDLIDFIDITRGFRGLGRMIKREINRYIKNVLKSRYAEFYAMKYKRHLSIAIKLAHPKSNNPLVDYILNKVSIDDIDNSLYPQLYAFEEYKSKETPDINDYVNLIERFKLEMQTLIGTHKPTERIWEALIPQMSAMQLIKNLASLERHIGGNKLTSIIKNQLSIERLNKGRVLPFRILQAYKMLKYWKLKRILGNIADDYAIQYDWSNLGKVCIAPDISASMGCRIAQRKVIGHNKYKKIRQVIPSEIAGIMTGILALGLPDSILLPWDQVAFQLKKRNKDSVYLQVERNRKIQKKKRKVRYSVTSIANFIFNATGCGTFMEAPIEYLLKDQINVDTCILITDSEEWGLGLLNTWIKYLNFVNKTANLVLIRIDPYPTNPFQPDKASDYNITQIYGWSTRVFRILENLNF
ncbi:MAG: TROVE domain-containing protein [Candidatus Lokiarchaeota archaeon]|nr:TROVE domain-containing protein [Candidatus Lokiarchaeota archaeon]